MVIEYPNVQLPPFLKEFDIQLRRLIESGIYDHARGIASLMKEFWLPGQVSELLLSALRDDQLIQFSARSSLAHPLGFNKFILTSRPGYQIRLHTWPVMCVPEGKEDIHNHRFAFASVVLRGHLLNETFGISPTGKRLRKLKEAAARHQTTFALRDDGEAHVRQSTVTAMPSGTVYFASPDVLHRTWVDRSIFTATLFVKFRSDRNDTTILVDPGSVHDLSPRRKYFSPTELSRIWADLADELS